MADAEAIREVCERYPRMLTEGDVDGLVALYAEDAMVEDPIGSPLHRGIDGIRAFYQGAAGKVTMSRSGPVRMAANEAATPLVVKVGPEGPDQTALDIISTMVFDEAGRITSMRAYWSMDAMRPATADD
jgi:steroid delta-isomerase